MKHVPVMFDTGCVGGPDSLACAAGLDGARAWVERGLGWSAGLGGARFSCKPDARARESVLRTQQNRSNPEINE